MPPREFPRRVAVFTDRFIFTTLLPSDVESHRRVPFCHPVSKLPCRLFSLDSVVEYTPFAHERGPLNISYVHESCVLLEKELRTNPGKVICLYTKPEPSAKANILLVAALYHLICNQAYPWQAFEPLAQLEVMPFRDAGKGSNDHGLTIEDCLYAIYKALQYDLIDLGRFSKSWYRHYERVQNGDLNLVADFIAFASPIEEAWAKRYSEYLEALAQGKQPQWPSLPLAKSLPQPFAKVLGVFEERNVGVVVRLNDELYDKRHFTDRGIPHVDLYFDDGSNPSDEIVREFITLATEYIERRKQRVAVHCKAGLGRTGVLIGAYLIYKYHFSAQEAIGLMRLIRPGMVVGEQQQYMLLNQMKWVTWAARDEMLKELSLSQDSPSPTNPLATPPAEVDPTSPVFSHVRNLGGEETIVANDSDSVISKPASHPNSGVKGGDALGQPRKGFVPLLLSYTRATLASVTELVDVEMRPAMPPRAVSVPTISVESIPSRGKKRAATRIPVPTGSSKSEGHEAAENSRLAPLDIVQRSPSIASVASSAGSETGKPARKRAARSAAPTPSSPLGRTGLSSPPLSRENTPAEVGMGVPDSPEAANLSKVANKLRRKPSTIRAPAAPNPTSRQSSAPLSSGRKQGGRADWPSAPGLLSPIPLPTLDEAAGKSLRKKTFTSPRMFRLGSAS